MISKHFILLLFVLLIKGSHPTEKECPFSFYVKIESKKENVPGSTCAGSLLSNRVVLTTHQCIRDDGFSYTVRVGVSPDNLEGQLIPALHLVRHEDYGIDDSGEKIPFNNDIGLIILAYPADLSNKCVHTINPPKLVQNAMNVEPLLIFSNQDSSTYTGPQSLKMLSVSIDKCESKLPAVQTLNQPYLSKSGIMCSKELSFCTEGGSPLIDSLGKSQIGILIKNGKEDCEKSSEQAMFTNISNYLEWIHRKMNQYTVPRECAEMLIGHLHYENSLFTVYKKSGTPMQVHCDMKTDGGGWTVIQQRGTSLEDGEERENFFQNYSSYLHGFGTVGKDFWIGLENIADLTQFGDSQMRIDLEDWYGEKRYALYDFFQLQRVSGSPPKFKLALSGYSGNPGGDSMLVSNGMFFSTYDNDQDAWAGGNCAQLYRGAWWYNACHDSNLNGEYAPENSFGRTPFGVGMNWRGWTGYYISLKKTRMMIRSNSFTFLAK